MNATEYIADALCEDVRVEVRPAEWRFPAYFEKAYAFEKCIIGGVPFILMHDRGQIGLTANEIMTQGERVSETTGLTPVYVAGTLPGDGRRRMVARRFSYIVPGKGFYLPTLCACMTESMPKKSPEYTQLGNAAQYLAILYLNGMAGREQSIAAAMAATGYSRMSVIQAFNELVYFKAGSHEGTRRHFHFLEDRAALWEELRPVMRNPCVRTIGLERIPAGLKPVVAGTSALCLRSMLSPLEQREFAVRLRDFNAIGKTETVNSRYAPFLLQLWSYVPCAMGDGAVDPYSLCLSLEGNSDDRVQIGLDEMMRSLKNDSRT